MSHIRRLVVVSHVVHYRHGAGLFAYGPYAREIDIWADLFPEVIIAAPCRDEAPPLDSLPFTRANIRIAAQKEHGGDSLRAKLAQIVALPALTIGLARTLAGADAVHVRCPGNLGLLGAVLAPLFSRRVVAKYAGQWNGYRGEPFTVRCQRWLLASRWWCGPVTVYGAWPNQPLHVVSFFTSMMSGDQLQRAGAIAETKRIGTPLRVLFSGVLSPRKRAAALLDGVKLATERGVAIELVLVGDGPERRRLERQAAALGIADRATFIGALPFEEALRWYEWAHCLVLPSVHSEGWPKVVAEAMSFALVCVAVDHGQLKSMLDRRGRLLARGDAEEIAGALVDIATHPAHYEAMAHAGALWARQYSLEGLRSALATLLSTEWQASLRVERAPIA
jgi:glycosyltransferase involved in cell wall biosynthesis